MQVGGIEQEIVLKVFRTWSNYVYLIIVYNCIWWRSQVYNKFKEYEKIQVLVIYGHVIYIQNQTCSFFGIIFNDKFEKIILIF